MHAQARCPDLYFIARCQLTTLADLKLTVDLHMTTRHKPLSISTMFRNTGELQDLQERDRTRPNRDLCHVKANLSEDLQAIFRPIVGFTTQP